MNRNYTLDHVEALRTKANISYEEAVALLDKYDGDMARALIELEKRGVIDNKPAGKASIGFVNWLKRVWVLGMRTRIHVTKNNETLVNLSVTYLILFVICAPYFALASLLLLLVLGCKITLIKNSNIYGSAEIKTMVSNAANNIRESVQSFSAGESEAEDESAPAEEDAAEAASDDQATEPVREHREEDDYPSITIE